MENRDDLAKYTIPQLLRWRVAQSGEKVALREKDFGRWNTFTWIDYYDHVRKSGLGLAELGLAKGDRIALIGDNIPELLFVAIGAQALGAISAGLYQSSLPKEIAGILNYLGVSIVFCDDQEQVDKSARRSPRSARSFSKIPAACAATVRTTGSCRSKNSIIWAMRPMPKPPKASNSLWIKAHRTMSAISASHRAPPVYPRGPR